MSYYWEPIFCKSAVNNDDDDSISLALQPCDAAEANLGRLRFHWEAEVSRVGLENASLFKALVRSVRTRLFVAMACMVVCSFFQFLGPVRDEGINIFG